MMRYLLSTILIPSVLFFSCCREDSIETARYPLTENELNIIPYEPGQEIPFIHSNGFEFSFTVIEDIREWNRYTDFCEWNCCGQDYFSYEVKTTTLQADYPNLNIEFSLGENTYNDYFPKIFQIQINHRHFASIPYDSLGNFICDSMYFTNCFDSLTIQNHIYTNVTEKYFDSHYFIDDSSILVPETILYNASGLLQIKMSNNESFSLVN